MSTAPHTTQPALERVAAASGTHATYSHHRRQHAADPAFSRRNCGSADVGPPAPATKCLNSTSKQTIPTTEVLDATAAAKYPTLEERLPDRTCLADIDLKFVDDDDEDDENDDDVTLNTKDCVDCASPSAPAFCELVAAETEQLQQRFSRIHHTASTSVATPTQLTSRHPHDGCDPCFHGGPISAISDGCASGVSSVISSPSPSTVSSPLSTPTRHTTQLHHSHQHCCQKSGAGAGLACPSHHHIHQSTSASCGASGSKKLQKGDQRFGPSPYRQLLPIALCILSFATVFSVLIIYMDTTEIRHQQFRLNMSRDYELNGVAQNDPTLVAFLREIHMRKYSMHFLKSHDTSGPDPQLNLSAHYSQETPEMAHYVSDLVGGKMNGAVIQSLPGAVGHLMTAPWLTETLNWAGVIVEPEPRRFFTLGKQNANRPRLQVVHACVSNNPYPKEITIHKEEPDVRINSLLEEETSWFNSRVKCFPLYTIMLACNRVEYDLLSLGVHGHELEILQTLPFDKIKVDVISIHLPDSADDVRSYVQTLTKFLMGKSYKLQKKFGRNYFFQRIASSASRTRRKDILLLKTP